jgi:hypothetical protein
MKKEQEDQDKKKQKQTIVLTSFQGGTTPPPSFCQSNECMLAPPSPTVSSPQTPTSSTAPIWYQRPLPEEVKIETSAVGNSSLQCTFTEMSEKTLAELLPSELYTLIWTAAKQGFLLSTLLTLSEERYTQVLKQRGFTAEQIYWINQGIRALTLILLGAPTETAIAVPILHYLMTTYLDCSKTKANFLSAGAGMAITLANSPLSIFEASIALGTATSAALVGSKLTRAACRGLRNMFFGESPTAREEPTLQENSASPPTYEHDDRPSYASS